MDYDQEAAHRGHEYASAYRRLIAGLYDWLISLMIGFGISLILGIVAAVIGSATHGPYDGADLSILLILFVPIFYTPVIAAVRYAIFALRVADGRSTPGHDRLGMRIEAIDGNPIGRWRAFKRQWFGSPAVMFLSLGMGPLLALQAVSDLFEFSYGTWSDPISMLFETVFAASLIAAPVLAIANHVWMAVDGKGRGWHDRLFGTVVVKYR